jgi:hypothetical protein
VSSLLSSVHLYQRAFFLLKLKAYSQPSTCLCTVCVLSIMIFLSLLIVLQCIYQSTWKFNAVHLLFSWNNISEFLCSWSEQLHMNLSAALDCFLNLSLSFDKKLHIWYLNLEIFS